MCATLVTSPKIDLFLVSTMIFRSECLKCYVGNKHSSSLAKLEETECKSGASDAQN